MNQDVGEISQDILTDCHTYTFAGRYYLINTNTLAHKEINEKIFRTVNERNQKENLHIDNTGLEVLTSLGLCSGEKRDAGHLNGNFTLRKTPPVTNMTLMIAHLCNLKCIYCYGDDGEYSNSGIMTKQIGLNAVDWLIEHSGKKKNLSITFFGGEPLLNFELIKDIVAYTEKKATEEDLKFNYRISTNGSLLDKEKIDFFKEKNFNVLIGFDGPPEIQNRNRPYKDGSNTYEKVTENVKKLGEVMPGKVYMRATVFKNEDFSSVVKKLYDIAPAQFQIYLASPSLHKKKSPLTTSLMIDDSCLSFILEEADQFIRAIKQKDQKTASTKLKWMELNAAFMNTLHARKTSGRCGVGTSSLAISKDGKIYPCHRFVGMDDYRIGTVHEDALQRDLFLLNSTAQKEPCKSCWLKKFCNGGCLHNNFSNTNDIFTTSPNFCNWFQSWFKTGIYIHNQLSNEDYDFINDKITIIRSPCPLDF